MSTSKKNDPKFKMSFDRAMLRSTVVSLFWGILSERKKSDGLTLQAFAKKVGTSKHEVSRWFGKGDPNWTLNTIASIANALEVELRIEAVDSSGRIFKASGISSEPPAKTEAITVPPSVRITKVTNSSESKIRTETNAAFSAVS
ncbi:helix-turn-helix domain-containing protein [Bradyrhizobium sp. PMVTL-01]|uniref:helix-turn-helix domain-containing protein n=1 Tax=Bradyrhizobium sp. PMVTL-01 TaxID=3434999 RepID=UPI003F720A2B